MDNFKKVEIEMNINDLLSHLEKLEAEAKRFDVKLTLKNRLTRSEKDAQKLISEYIEIYNEIEDRLEHDFISKKEILSNEIQEEKNKLHESHKIKQIQLENTLNTRKLILDRQKEEFKQEINAQKDILEQEKNAAVMILKEKAKGFPWLANAWAEYLYLVDMKQSEYLKNKKHPALKAAEKINDIAKEKRILEKQFRVTYNLVEYYEALFPWLPEFIGENLDDLIEQITNKSQKEDSEDDPVRFYLTKGEYENLSITERNQRALDRYWSKKKSSWEIGRDYERYIGYLYEQEGYSVYYQGIEEGLEDLGRDLIANRNAEARVIQCKYWAKYKTIHEKHICQLFGTTLKYWIEQKHSSKQLDLGSLMSAIKGNKIKGVFFTSTSLSEVAREFANELGIEVKESFPFKEYPSIKCNVVPATKEKIYHLPIDQQYDRTIIRDKEECYVWSVKEAEALGFRRAYRWMGGD